jgi:NTE family protein
LPLIRSRRARAGAVAPRDAPAELKPMIDLEFLANVPIFRFFTRAELEAAQRLFKEVSFAKDDVVVRIGEPGDVFYVVLEGELEVWDASQPPRQTGSLKRGDYFGEMALLQGGRRTATVTVARRADLIAIDKPAFDRLFLQNSKAIEHFARVLSKRLAGVTRGERIQRATMTVSVGGSRTLKGKTLVARALASVLGQLTATRVIRVEVLAAGGVSDPAVHDLTSSGLDELDRIFEQPNGADGGATGLKVSLPSGLDIEGCGYLLASLVSKLSDQFSFIVLDLSAEWPALIRSSPAYSDALVVLVDAPGEDPGISNPRSMKVLRVINLFNRSSRPVPISSSEPFVLPRHAALGRPPEEAGDFIRTNPRSAPGLPVHRLAHKLLGTSIGLALGGGAAFGLAHIGVLKVLEEAGVPVDLVAGCSQGSIIAVGYASGLRASELADIARELGVKRNFLTVSDPTFFTQPGIIAGGRFLSMIRPYLKGKDRFEQLVLPCRTVATDVETGERIAIGSGKLETAYRASSAVPMVITPLKVGERVLVDGGVADPVPAEVVVDMGADLTIAVNVVPRLKRGIETVLSSLYRKINAFNPLSYMVEATEMPSLFDIVMNSMQILQYELGNFKAISADVLINPDLSDFTWIEYYRADELMARGEDAARQALPAIEKAIEARIAPIRRAAPRAGAAAGT